jgi:hypothetical protein
VGGTEWANAFLSHLETRRFSPATVRAYAHRLWETARRLEWSYYWARSVIDQFVPAVIAWSYTPIGKLDKETLDNFAAALEEVTSASATTLRQWRGRLFGLRQLLFECGQLPKPPKRGPDGVVALGEVGAGEIVDPGCQIARVSSSKAARTRRFIISSAPSS